MRIILLSGGSGKRLWPLSNDVRSKLFLKLLPGEDGRLESMIQRVCRQLAAAGLAAQAAIVTHRSQAEITRSHVGLGIPIIEESRKRGTYAAVAQACSYLAGELKADRDEIVCVLPVDLFVESDFFDLLQRLPQTLQQAGADIALVGTAPSHPSSQYGYIVPERKKRASRGKKEAAEAGDGKELPWFSVERFAEKPDPPTAASLIRRGALWNCGVFAFRLGYMLERMGGDERLAADGERREGFRGLRESSFDEEVVERCSRRAALLYEGPWHDLGSWETFVSHMGGTQIGPGHVAEGSHNTHLINELSSPIHVIGLCDVIVAASPDGILVASKSEASRIKSMLGEQARLPMYEEKRWGICRTIDYAETEDGAVLTRRVELQPGSHTSYHLHERKEEVWTVLAGTGRFMLEDQIYTVGPGDVMRFPPGARHGVKAVTELLCMQVEIGDVLDEKDIERLLMSW
ncbi:MULTISPECIES: sugar phosphate nucleotidyltransferase [unclassified Paenibacillus]|uniref:sugar phosphate nucleotidyltransferase n=1 Tax=unclassified Paenibacillus TaxID=185978 RepID=UPI0009555828|nr:MULTISPECIES: sugar phosphate nucleotidyltransferase [unclassified Paenibacillus]ASS67449.1 cupin domain-containing protein [Paenibacillus sp. RUD330]SIQ76657.1 mannose-1-phosphate guanylyltransferase [Paenibacillus sp. RU4X]SIQ98065.1 mannose-1-phosphate guanylyltransferase [Paenibacillus sp. RU4T]